MHKIRSLLFSNYYAQNYNISYKYKIKYRFSNVTNGQYRYKIKPATYRISMLAYSISVKG